MRIRTNTSAIWIGAVLCCFLGNQGCKKDLERIPEAVSNPPVAPAPPPKTKQILAAPVLPDKTEHPFGIVDVLDLGHSQVRNFAFCPTTGRLYVSFSYQNENVVYEWNVDEKRQLRTYSIGDQYMVDGLAISPTGSPLVVSSFSAQFGPNTPPETLTLFDTRSGHSIKEIVTDERNLHPTFSPDGSTFWTDDGAQAYGANGLPKKNAPYPDPRKKNPGLRIVENSKMKVEEPGLYYRDSKGVETYVISGPWHNNNCILPGRNLVVSTTWIGELVIWSTQSKKEVHHLPIADAYGYLACDPIHNRAFIGDATKETTMLRELTFPEGI